jgi:hypothetical protein
MTDVYPAGAQRRVEDLLVPLRGEYPHQMDNQLGQLAHLLAMRQFRHL